ncbi:GNAT family N-acetyltransferase [Oceanobacillus picturae]|uniref:GNAT family N-acetyltransferase n=1 Tax=Oceanobacillus picturae TaxID=171693 RepID=UPI000E68DE39|nr:GNAT family protein [Oceanobacillus picturae]RIU91117.1 N-acetyltransferase [Oceanobacillus picturae]
MAYIFRVMTQEEAENIAFNWHYEGDYSFYDMEADEEDMEEFLNPEARGDSTFAVKKEEDLVAFFSVTKVNESTVNIGLGMRPDLTGKGMGDAFLKASLKFVEGSYSPDRITLSVATFNQRAINAYRKIGFRDMETFMQATNGSTYEFLKMSYTCA